MTKEELGLLYPVTIVSYNPEWPNYYRKEISCILGILGSHIALHFEHIGSTAVPGLAAKPTIDILVQIPLDFDHAVIISKMTNKNYIHMTEQTRHLMFVKGYAPTGLEKISFHIHMGPRTQPWLWDRIYFRDYLVNNHAEALRYESLKYDLASKYKNDREAYTEMKAEYIQGITELAKKQYNKPHANSRFTSFAKNGRIRPGK